MTQKRCSMAALVEAQKDGRLGAREEASVARHLRTCSACRQLADDLEPIREIGQVPVPELSQLDHQRGRVMLLQAAARVGSVPTRSRRPVLVAAVVLAATVCVLVSSSWMRSRALPARLEHAALPSATSVVATSVRTATTLTPDPGARFTRTTSDGEDIVTLEDGAVTFSVRHLQSEERFVVETRDAEVEVRGTIFRVESQLGRIRAVRVTEGRVEVRFAGTVTLVGPGEWWAPLVSSNDTPRSAAARPNTEASTDRVARAATSQSSAVDATSNREPGSELEPATSTLAPDEKTRAFGDAVRMFERGDYGAAAARLDEFSTAHPSDSRAEDADFLAILALKRSGRSAEAAVLARRYLERHPNGYRRTEAETVAAGH